MGGLVGNLPGAKIMHSKGFSCGRKDAGVEGEIEGGKVSQDTPKVGLLRFSSPASLEPGGVIVSRHIRIKHRNLRLQLIRHRFHWTLTDELTKPNCHSDNCPQGFSSSQHSRGRSSQDLLRIRGLRGKCGGLRCVGLRGVMYCMGWTAFGHRNSFHCGSCN